MAGNIEFEVPITTQAQTGRVKKTANDNALGKRIRQARKEKHWTIKDLAERVGCSSTHVTRIELGQRRLDSMNLLKSFAAALNISADELLGLAGQSLQDNGSYLRSAFPSIKTVAQENAVNKFAILITSINLTDLELNQILDQATAYAEFCERHHSENL